MMSFKMPRSLDLKAYIREIPDFPKEGILFYDISTLIGNGEAWQIATSRLALQIAELKPDLLVAIESRGFLTASAVATRLGCGFTMLRKPGKLPGETISRSYGLEYGQDTLHIQKDAVKAGQRVVIMDDLLATGGTLEAAIALLKDVGAEVVAASVLIELEALKGREQINVPLLTLLTY